MPVKGHQQTFVSANRLFEDPTVHKLTAEVQNLLKPRNVYLDPALVKRVFAKMAEA